MRRVIFMCGPAGSGKSTIARQYERQGMTRLSFDQEAWSRGIATMPLPEAVHRDIEGVLRARLLDLVRAGADVVLDFSFWSRSMRDDYRELLRPFGVVPETVYLATDRATALQRIAARAAGDGDDFQLSTELAAAYFDHFEVPGPAEGPLTVLTGTTPASPPAFSAPAPGTVEETGRGPPRRLPSPRPARRRAIAAPCENSSNTATSRRDYAIIPRMGQMRQKDTDGATRAQARQQRSVRRSLWRVGALASLGAVGVGALAACSGGVATNADQATAAVTKLGRAADGANVQSRSAPAIISRAIAHGRPVEPSRTSARKHARRPRPSSSATPTPPSALGALTATPTSASTQAAPTATPTTAAAPTATPTTAPTGGRSGSDPSGQNPATGLSGYTLKYVQEFTGSSLPANWGEYLGVPGGETSSEADWEPGMCTFSGGEARFMASGVDSCGLHYQGDPQEYGAWFARLQAGQEPSGELFSDIFLLWPANNQWPPEIDVYEDEGNRSRTVATLWNTVGSACGSSPSSQCLYQYTQTNGGGGGVANTDTEWHTYGVEWTPAGVSWLIDGHVILTAPAAAVKSPAHQPALPMNMALQSQNLQGSPGASSTQDTMNVDWVEQFSWNA